MINLLHKNDTFVKFIINVYKPTANLSALCSSCAEIAFCFSKQIFTFFFLYTSLFFQPHKQKSNGGIGEQFAPDSNISISVTIQN